MTNQLVHISPSRPVVCWFSGGVTSAVACHEAIKLYGKENVRVIFIDTRNEHEDLYRFLEDCERWYDIPIEHLTNPKYKSIEEVWYKYLSLNVATGAICSSELKRAVREKFQRENSYSFQVFGYDIDEPKRAKAMTKNYPDARAVYLLMLYGLTKKDCIEIVQNAGIEIPVGYKMGYKNNNCLRTGCTQGGIGYWQLVEVKEPPKFDYMANVEHELTDLAGKPVTMLKDQSAEAKKTGRFQVFLKPHPDYPDHKDISMMKGRPPKPLMECNGFCGTNDFMPRNETEKEINFQTELEL